MDCKNLKFQLLSGDLMPAIGFGTYKIIRPEVIREILDYALEAGYRSIDTATVYHNEEDIGAALKELLPKYGLKREDIFITSKLPPSHHGDRAYTALHSSLQKLGCRYLDLYLIHWPGQVGTDLNDPIQKEARRKSWENLVRFKKDGLVRNIGVSNYTVRQLNELLENCFGIKPSVNQVEFHPHYHQDDLKELCKAEGILLQAYSSLGGSENRSLITDHNVVAIAKKLDKEPAQVLLRWALQENIGIIPKASTKAHIESNIDLNFEIPAEDMDTLNNLPQRKYSWDPSNVQ